MVKFIDDEKKKYGVESICRILPIAPSTYYRIKDEQENPEKQSRRKQSDKHLMAVSYTHLTLPTIYSV